MDPVSDTRLRVRGVPPALSRIPNGHGPVETRRECHGCLGYLVTKPLAKDRGILGVAALVRPLEYFDPDTGGIVDTIAFFSTKRRSR